MLDQKSEAKQNGGQTNQGFRGLFAHLGVLYLMKSASRDKSIYLTSLGASMAFTC